MSILIFIILIFPYIISYFLYKRGLIWYKNGIVLSILFWISVSIMGIIGDKFNEEINEVFFFYYFWFIWIYIILLIISIVFWIYNDINTTRNK